MPVSMKKRGYLPDKEADQIIWSRESLDYLNGHTKRLKISAPTLKELIAKREDYAAALEKTRTSSRSREDTMKKNAAKSAFITALRRFFHVSVLFNPRLTDLDRERIGLKPRRTRSSTGGISSFPRPALEKTRPGEVTLSYLDSENNSRTKPQGVQYAELRWIIRDQAPESAEEFPRFALLSKSPFVLPFEEENRGRVVHFRMRWINREGRGGPWSGPVKAIVS